MRSVFSWILAVLVAGPVLAQEPGEIRIDMCVSGKGMSRKIVTKTRKQFTRLLRSRKVEFVTPPRQGDCCTSPSCLGEEAVQQGAHGILVVEMLRFGPVVKATFYLFDAVTKKPILMAKGTSSARNFPAGSSFASELSRCLNVLKKHVHKQQPAVAAAPQKPEEIKSKPATRPPPPGSRVDRNVTASSRPPAVQEAAPAGPSGTAWYWLGGSLLAGGVSLVAAGTYFLLVPMSQAEQDRLDAEERWEAADRQEEIEKYSKKIKKYDEAAWNDCLLGWIGIGLGAGLLVGGTLALILGPDDAQPRGMSLRPLVMGDGGGLVIELPW